MDAVSPYRQRKLAARFAQHDVDGDGFLQERDYRALAQSLGERLAADEDVREAIAAGFAEQWQQLCAHAGIERDGRLNLAEYTAAMGAGIATDQDSLQRAVLQTSLAVLRDADADGYLGLPEWERLGDLLRVGDAKESFALLDTDADGRLSSAEIADAVRDFYTSDDPATPGNLVFGQF